MRSGRRRRAGRVERNPLPLELNRACLPTPPPRAPDPRMELATLGLRGSARSAWGAAAHALRHPVVGPSQLCTPLGIPVQPSRELDIDLTWQTPEHLVYCLGPTG